MQITAEISLVFARKEASDEITIVFGFKCNPLYFESLAELLLK